MRICKPCGRSLPPSAFVQLRSGKPYSYCKECHSLKCKSRYLANRETYLQYRREYHQRNRDKIIEQDRNARLKRKLQVLSHYGHGAARCVCCGVTEYEFLTLDHIDASGADHRKQLKKEAGIGGHATGWFIYKWLLENGLPKGYQTLCFNCNVGKHRTKINRCPHELARQELTLVGGSVRINQAA